MPRRDKIIIQKIISEINISNEMLNSKRLDEFLNDEMLKRAVSMTVINIGELVKNISEEIKIEYPNIPWKAIAGMRDLTAHKYQTLRMEDVYETAIHDFQELKNELVEILNKIH